MNIFQKLKRRAWRHIYPVFPQLQSYFVWMHNNKRQPWHVGWLAPHHTLAGLKRHLSKEWGFGNHFVAWEDSSQVLSWRKLNSFQQQYHLRVFNDGEIRGHFEMTPESAPILHLLKTNQKARTNDFLKFLGPFVTTKKHVSALKPDTTVLSPQSEITF